MILNRREFAEKCLSCAAAVTWLPLLGGCQSVHYSTGTMDTNGISVLASEFRYLRKGQAVIRPYIILKNEAMEFPIYLYRVSDSEYTAVLMKCTHQGNELSASGDHLSCSAHGSEFNNKGVVVQGPADKNLRTFAVTTDSDKIIIDLRA
jgi:Rieske Fe-S protein